MTDLEYSNIRKNCEVCNNVLSVERHDPADPLEGFFCHKCKKWVCVDCTCFVQSDAYSSICKDCCDCYKSSEPHAEDSESSSTISYSKSYLTGDDFFIYNGDLSELFGASWKYYRWIVGGVVVVAIGLILFLLFSIN